MAERTTGVIVGGVIALIGAIFGLFGFFVLLGLASAASMTSMYFFVDITFGLIAMATTPAVGVLYAWLVLIGAILAIIFSILLIAGKAMRISAILLLIGGILSILVIFVGMWLWVLPGVLELLGAIIALATGAW